MNSPFIGGFRLTNAEHFLWEGCSIPHPPVRWADAKPLVSTSSGPVNTAEHQAATADRSKSKAECAIQLFQAIKSTKHTQ